MKRGLYSHLRGDHVYACMLVFFVKARYIIALQERNIVLSDLTLILLTWRIW